MISFFPRMYTVSDWPIETAIGWYMWTKIGMNGYMVAVVLASTATILESVVSESPGLGFAFLLALITVNTVAYLTDQKPSLERLSR